MSRRARRGVPLALSGALVACATGSPAPKPSTPVAVPPAQVAAAEKRELPERTELPMAIREALSASMARHGEELSFLLVSVVLLDYRAAEQLAQLIADEPKLGRPQPGETDTLNAMLPTAFFVHQEQLGQRAQTLGLAAREHDDAKLVKAFGALAETCVGCHSAYLHEELEALRAALYRPGQR